METSRLFLALLVIAVAGNLPSPVSAQTCIGRPGTVTVAASMSFPDNATGYGLRARQTINSFTFGVHVATLRFSGFLEGVDPINSFGGDIAYEVPVKLNAGASAIGFCPLVGYDYGKWYDVHLFAWPVGVAGGVALPLADGAVILAPYALPHYEWGRASADGQTETYSDFGLSIGANLLFSNILAGVSMRKFGDSDAVFSIRIGFNR
jgi:hypothetical protein